MALYIFFDRLYTEQFIFNIGVPRKFLDFFDSGKIRISVFYMRENIELVYILQNRVQNGIYIFSEKLYSEQFFF